MCMCEQWELLKREKMSDYKSTGIHLRHKQTGMEVFHFFNDDEENLQSIYGIHKQGGSFVVAHLAFCELHDQGPAVTVANSMEFGVQTALCASDAAGKSPFLSKLAAVR